MGLCFSRFHYMNLTTYARLNHPSLYTDNRTEYTCVTSGVCKYPYFMSERVYALHAAARWWYKYRNEVVSG